MSEPLSKSEKEKYSTVWKCDKYRLFSSGERSIRNLNIVDILRTCKVKTVLDAGCGSGKLMRTLIEEYGDEFSVHGFDIAENCLDPFFDKIKNDILTIGVLWDEKDFNKKYDAIICADVLEHIPTEKVKLVLDNLCRCTKIFCYLSIALFPDDFGPMIVGQPLHLTLKEPNWWITQIQKAGFINLRHITEKHPNGTEIWLHVLLFK